MLRRIETEAGSSSAAILPSARAASVRPIAISNHECHWCATEYDGLSSIARANLRRGGGPVPVVDEGDPRERGVGLAQRVVQLDRLPRHLLRPLHPLADRRPAVVDLQRVGVRQPGVGQRVARVLLRSPARSTGCPRRWPPGCGGSTSSGPSGTGDRPPGSRYSGPAAASPRSRSSVERSVVTMVRAISSWMSSTSWSSRS